MSKYTEVYSHILFLGYENLNVHFDRRVIFGWYFDQVLTAILHRERLCAGQRTHDSKCLNHAYIAYMINRISYKKFLDKPNWDKTNPMGGNIALPPRPDVTLI